jgi:hypothetical protein
MRYTYELIQQGLRLFFESSDFEDCPSSRATITKKINDDFAGEFTTYNIQQAAKACKSQLPAAEFVTPKKQRREIYWAPQTQQSMLEAAGKRLGWTPLATNENVHVILSLLQKAGAEVSEENVFVACQSLGKSALEHNAPAPPPPPPPAPRPIKFDWYSIGAGEIPLVDPIDGNPPPTGYLQSNAVSSAQLHSLIRRQEMQKKPYLSGYPDQGLANKSRR